MNNIELIQNNKTAHKTELLQAMFKSSMSFLAVVDNNLLPQFCNPAYTKQYAQQAAIQSFIMVPLVFQGNVLGNMGVDMIEKTKTWSQENILHFKLLVEVIVNALVRKEKESKINELRLKLEAENNYLREEIKLTYAHGDIVGQSPGIQKVLHQLEHVAPPCLPT